MGSMLAMLGGRKALEPLKEPITLKLQEIIWEMKETKTGDKNLATSLISQVEQIVDQRLDELTRKFIKSLVNYLLHLRY